ncbi:MAG: PepSY-associated TM helix domain-containing protein [Akkermansiaceae bacterium]
MGRTVKKKKFKTVLIKQFYIWHWVSSAISLTTLLLFAITGLTLNNAKSITTKPVVSEITGELPAALTTSLTDNPDSIDPKVIHYLNTKLESNIASITPQIEDEEIYLSHDSPGKNEWLSLDQLTGEFIYEKTSRGSISFINDLHKGRNTGSVWGWFMDIFSVACIIFTLTGIGLLWVHSRRRPTTWPVVALGILLPVIIVIFFIH